MTKKDYVAIARALHSVKRDYANRPNVDPEAMHADTVVGIAEVLAADSPRFDRARFIEACETGSDKEAAKLARKAGKAARDSQREDYLRSL